jgi:hypothetical protein
VSCRTVESDTTESSPVGSDRPPLSSICRDFFLVIPFMDGKLPDSLVLSVTSENPKARQKQRQTTA